MPKPQAHRARKRFGQNFLHDASIIERMLAAIRVQSDDCIVEVGPGLGALTLPLLEQLSELHVVEIDRDLIERLEQRQLPGLHIHSGDVLNMDFTQLSATVCKPPQKLRVVGNLPYNIGTPLLIRLLAIHPLLHDIHVMLQKEVVDRLHASTNTRAYGRLTVMMQSTFDITPLFTVPPESFDPAPKVQSAIVRLKPRKDALGVSELDALQSCTRLAFANKRKTLRNNFKGHLDETTLQNLGVDPQARAETLSLDSFLTLAKHLSLR